MCYWWREFCVQKYSVEFFSSHSMCVCARECGNASWRQKHAHTKQKVRGKKCEIWNSVKLRKRAKRWHFNQSIDFILMWNPTQYNTYPREFIYPFLFRPLFLSSPMPCIHEVTLPRSNSISRINQIILLLKMYGVCYNVITLCLYGFSFRCVHVFIIACVIYRLIRERECMRSIDRNTHTFTFFLRLIAI